MHLVYFHPDKFNGYGATREDRWPRRLEEQGLDVSKGYIVERGLTEDEAGERERELQLRDGYPIDNTTYKQTLLNFHSKRARNKKSKSLKGREFTDEWKSKISERRTGTKDGPKPTLRTPILATKDGITQKFESQTIAAEQLSCTQVGISHVLTGLQKTHRGYIFEYGH